MLETLIEALCSPLVAMVMLVIFTAIAFIMKMTGDGASLSGIVEHAASGFSIVLIVMLAVTFFDLHTTCRILLDSNLLQIEFATVMLTGLWHMVLRYFFKFDPPPPRNHS